MSSDLDERLRQRVASLFEDAGGAEEADLSARARALGEAWRLDQQRARKRTQLAGASLVLAAAAGLLLWLRLQPEATQPMAAEQTAPKPGAASPQQSRASRAKDTLSVSRQALAASQPLQPTAARSNAQPPPAPEAVPGRALDSSGSSVTAPLMAASPTGCRLPSVSAFPGSGAASRSLGLGEFGRLVTGAGAQLRVVASHACELRVALDEGSVAGELHALRPGRLVIQTPAGSVVVTGTRFSVRVAGASLEVVLASGTVGVELPERPALQLAPGRRLSLRKRGAEPMITQLTAADSQRLDQQLSAVASASEAPRSAAPVADPITSAAPPHVVSVRAPAPTRARVVTSESAETAEPNAQPAAAADLIAKAEQARRRGQIEVARSFYGAAADGGDANAEVAMLRWARLELDQHAVDRAAALLARHEHAFAAPQLAAEAAWLNVQVLLARGDVAGARAAAEQLVREHASTPQARVARAWLNRR